MTRPRRASVRNSWFLHTYALRRSTFHELSCGEPQAKKMRTGKIAAGRAGLRSCARATDLPAATAAEKSDPRPVHLIWRKAKAARVQSRRWHLLPPNQTVRASSDRLCFLIENLHLESGSNDDYLHAIYRHRRASGKKDGIRPSFELHPVHRSQGARYVSPNPSNTLRSASSIVFARPSTLSP